MTAPTPPKASRVRRGTFTLKAAADDAPVVFSCSPTSITLTPEGGDAEDALEVLCGTSIPGELAPTSWTLAITSIQEVEQDAAADTSLVLYSLAHDGETVAFTFQPSPTSKTFEGEVTVVAIAIGGDVGPATPTSDAEWPMAGPPTVQAPPPENGGTAAPRARKEA